MRKEQNALSISKFQQPWLSLVGLTEAGWQGLAADAKQAVEQASLLVGSARQLGLIPEISGQQRLQWPSPLQDGIDEVLQHSTEMVCVLASGDPFWFGIGATLSRQLPASAMRCFPGPSAFSLTAARQSWPLQDCLCLSVVARDVDRLRSVLAPGQKLLVLSEDGSSPSVVAKTLCAVGYGASLISAWQRLGGSEESCYSAVANQWGEAQVDTLNTLAIECISDHSDNILPKLAGRNESLFVHDGQISKREVRAAIIAYLAPQGAEVLWDLGSGSGAIAVEWLLADNRNMAYSVEQKELRCHNIKENARRFGVSSSLHCFHAASMNVLADLPQPDAIFIGGGISAPGLLACCWAALADNGRCVASAVSVEGEAALYAARARYGGELTRIGVERSEALGRFTGWQTLRTVTVWHAQKIVDSKSLNSKGEH